MKIFTFLFGLLLLSVTASAQNCIQANSAYFTNPSNDGVTWSLTINWQADGQKHMNVVVRSNASIILNTCFSVQAGGGATGTKVYNNLIAPGGIPSLSATFERWTGNCGGGSSCGTTQIISPGGGTLPISMGSFYAIRNGKTVALSWTSETEINAKDFVIERNSGNGFEPIAVIAAVNNERGSSYAYTDVNISRSVSQYRLKLVDMDASYKYSETRAVKGTAAVSDFTVYPNPSFGNARVTITDLSEASHIDLIDNAGRIVKTIVLTSTNSIDLDNLQNGLYLIRISNKKTGDAVTRKLTVVN